MNIKSKFNIKILTFIHYYGYLFIFTENSQPQSRRLTLLSFARPYQS